MTPQPLPHLSSALLTTVVAVSVMIAATPALANDSAQATASSSSASASVALTSTLTAGEQLGSGESIVSPSGAQRLTMQSDGNAVTYEAGGRPTWSTGTQGRGDHLVMQSDGNLVVYSPTGSPVWASGTAGEAGASVTMQDDGNLVVYRRDGSPAWASASGGALAPARPAQLGAGEVLNAGQELTSDNRRYRAVQQGDGNLVVYGPIGALWASNTSGAGSRLVMQDDGNAVVYRGDGSPAWASGTAGHPDSYLRLEDDGDLVLYEGRGTGVLWSSRAQVSTDTLNSPGTLRLDERLVSANGAWRAVMQPDGNFVVYGPGGASWATGTTRTPGWRPSFEVDETGALEVTGAETSTGIWWYTSPRSSAGGGQAVAPFRLVMQDDGNLVEYDARGRAVWASRG